MSRESNATAGPGENAPADIEANDPFGLKRFSLQRYSVRYTLMMISTLGILAWAGAKAGMNGDWTTTALTLSALTVVATTLFLMVRITVRMVFIEQWIRRLGMGDFEYAVAPQGNDELSKCCVALETLRQKAIEAMQLDLVRSLSEELQEKNQELESALEELRRTQDQVVSRQKLAELGVLTAGVAHEIRNPLNLVQNFARTSGAMLDELKETIASLDGTPSQEQRELVEELTGELTGNMERIRQHGGRTNRIVQDMLAMGRNSKGQFQKININELVETNAMLAFHSARSQDPGLNMKIHREFDPEAGEIMAVSEDMARVVLNLVSNACHATAERRETQEGHKGTMWLATARDGDAVEIRVRDNGPGITPEVMARMFNPFFTTRTNGRGTGLGLSLTSDIVREHGGTIVPESVVGEYAQFTVRIPAGKPETRNGADGPGHAPEDPKESR